MSNKSYKFQGKYIIRADLICKTGLHIGGTETGFEIGGLDNPVIKDPITGYPYIAGSSLKGKIRSLLEWAKGRVQIKEIKDKKGNSTGRWKGEVCNCGECDICIVFGASADTKGQKEPTRLIVRDSFPTRETIKQWQENLGDNIYTEVKTENSIDRLTSEANPRSMERVPAGSVFEVEMIYDIYKDDDVEKLKIIFEGMMLLEDSSLGGSGSRGSGKVVFENIRITKRDMEYYR
jgi:CRISPR-associated protein Csm3